MSAFSGGDVVCKVEDLGDFSLYSGFVTGKFIETVSEDYLQFTLNEVTLLRRKCYWRW